MNNQVTSRGLDARAAPKHEGGVNRYRLLLLMSACFACVALDNSKLVASLPALARLSGASPVLQRWTVEAGLLVYASLLLLGGALSERFGARRVLLLGLCGFGGASLLGADLRGASLAGADLSHARYVTRRQLGSLRVRPDDEGTPPRLRT